MRHSRIPSGMPPFPLSPTQAWGEAAGDGVGSWAFGRCQGSQSHWCLLHARLPSPGQGPPWGLGSLSCTAPYQQVCSRSVEFPQGHLSNSGRVCRAHESCETLLMLAVHVVRWGTNSGGGGWLVLNGFRNMFGA